MESTMTVRHQAARLLFGTDRKLQRMLRYWAATAVMYTITLGLMFGPAALAGEARALAICTYVAAGVAAFYPLVRASARIGLAPTALAGLQGVFSVSCHAWAYALAGPVRAATLMGLLVIVVFCAFALRPRQTLLLTACGVSAMGGTMWWHAAHDPLHFPPAVEAATFAIMAVSSLAVTLLTGEMSKLRARLKTQKDDLLAALETIRTLATVDELTTLTNRRHMNELLAQEERRRDACGGPTCLALMDIDFFKRINDRFGHAAGDDVLRAFAHATRAELREGDVLARWGGEEFLLMLPNTSADNARTVLERMRTRVAAIEPCDGMEHRVSFSAGLSVWRTDEPIIETVNRADQALYAAKAAGRNCLVEA
jgi:diguanylate cyclase (GGDEF)-like protein